jgi:hypothetical protein
MPTCPPELPETAVKLLSSTGGFLGGSSMLLYMRPSSFADAIRRCLVSVVAAAMLTVPIADKVFSSSSSEIIMGTAFAIGFVAWSMLGAVAKFFEKREGQDIVQMAKSAKPLEGE